jgi:hypothetical protein
MVLDWEPSQHCVTVAKVEHLARIASQMQKAMKAALVIGFVVGSVFGALCVGLAWLL